MKLLTIAELTVQLKALTASQTEVTLNLAYHAMIHGNVEPLAGFTKAVTSVLHKEYKAVIPALFDEKSKVWAYNKPKAIKLCTQFGFEYGVTTFDDFVNVVTTYVNPPAAEKTEAEKKDAAIKRIESAMSALLGLGLTNAELVVLANKAVAK
jgi:hypothetical protein